MKINKDRSIVGKLHLLTPKQIELIKKPSHKYIKILLLDRNMKTERLYVSSQKEGNEEDGIYDVELIKPFIP